VTMGPSDQTFCVECGFKDRTGRSWGELRKGAGHAPNQADDGTRQRSAMPNTDTENGVTATISGRMSVGRSLKYRVLVVHFEDIDTVIGIPMALAEQLIEEMKQQIEDIRKRTH